MTDRPHRSPDSPVTLAGRAVVVLGIVLALLYPVAAVRMSPDYHGSDPHWYVEDVAALMRGEPATTHEVYPFSLIGPDTRFDAERPFIHNLPVMRLWALAGNVAGDPYTGIRVLNILSAMLTGVLVFLTARRFTSAPGAVLAGVFALYVPVSFGSSGLAMAETFSATCVALGWYLALRHPGRLGGIFAAQAVVAIGALGRMWTLPLLLVVPLALLFDDARSSRERWMRVAAAGVAGVAGYLVLSQAFPNYMPSLELAALLEVTRSDNMAFYFRTEPLASLTFGAFAAKLAANAWESLQVQVGWDGVFPPPARLAANLAAVLSLGGILTPGATTFRRFALGGALIAFGSYLGMSVLYQNFARYAIPLMPVLVVGATVALDGWWDRAAGKRAARALIAGGLAILLAAFLAHDVQLIESGRASGLAAREFRAQAATLVDGVVPDDARVALDVRFSHRWTYDAAIQPRPVLSLGSNFAFTREQYARMFELFEPTIVIADGASRLPEYFELEPLGTQDEVTVYRVVAER